MASRRAFNPPPVGNSEIAYAENISAATTAVAGTTGVVGAAVDVPNCTIVVPPTARPVWIEVGFQASQTVAGQGQVMILLVETTGAPTTIETRSAVLPNDISARNIQVPNGFRVRIGPTVVQRTFKLQARCDSKAANTPTFIVANGPTTRSFIHAFAE